MAYGALFRRSVAALLVSVSLVTCSTDGLEPSARIDSGTRVGAIRPVREEPVSVAYPSTDMPVTAQHAANSRLPMIDSEAAPVQPSAIVPPEGVNMDAMLGVSEQPRVVGLAEEQNREIAEGNTAQPVVDGIGGDVRAVGQGQQVAMAAPVAAGYDPDLPPLSPEKMAAEQRRKAQFLEQEARVSIQPQASGLEQQVAFIPRAGNPLEEPDFTGRMPASEIACRQRLAKLGVEFRDVERIAKGRSCGIDYPIELSGLAGGIDVKPAVKLNCQVTEAFAKWVKNELVPSSRARYLSGVKTIKPLGGYSCRTMNSQRGNPMSEHAHGNAIDVGKFVLKSGKEIDVRKPGFFAFREKGLLKAVRSDSCKYFSTVLGPGSDPHHKDHFHFDLRARKSGYRHCD
ncbi:MULTISPECIES: extensin family protein [unclassified Rhizobium]|uniref:extensin-like domain-containing protein n=1 Tax=unclassified Rhizobium TaxID=2613769 RepID=UPI0006FA1B94|nr:MULTISPECIES: extensin family protein [unclassified Rhizobium]KQV34715.1 extensin [Rhizobium sp. Root1212]KRD24049.1 extensin [Rhizobium sp. Root268]